MDKKAYRQRIADQLLAQKLESVGAVLIEGPKWCGKTTTGEHVAESILYMDNPSEQNVQLAAINPKFILDGKTPRLIDEWQLAPKIWDAIRFEVDHRADLGQFILTGSAVPARTDEIYHTGTGRFSWLTMRPMSLWESGESSGAVSLHDLFQGQTDIAAISNMELDEIAFLICRGGWPRAITLKREAALNMVYDYFEAVIRSDVSRVDNVSRDAERMKRLMRSYARHQGMQAPIATIRTDMATNETESLDTDTVASYISALKKIFVVEDSIAWNPNLRSKTAIRTSDTRYYVDPSLATAALGLGPQDLINDLNTMGLLFETLAVRDIRVYADALGGTVYHYRDKSGLECDAVLHLRNGSYGLIEIKLGGENLIEEGAKTLQALADKIDNTKMKSPSFLMLLTATGKYAYRRPDGVLVVPIACLKD